jgi:hypothetical protein
MYVAINVKFAIARQAKEAYQYKDIKLKLHRTNAAIWYNKLCRQLQLAPKYIAIKVNRHNQQHIETVYICRNKIYLMFGGNDTAFQVQFVNTCSADRTN